MPWELFRVFPTPQAYRVLRRYVPNSTCPAFPHLNRLKYHSRWQLAGESEFHSLHYSGDKPPYTPEDPRWPATCECGYQFGARDARQHSLARIFEGERCGFTVRGTAVSSPALLPPGATWCVEPGTEIAKSARGPAGPDGNFWFIMLPGHMVWEPYASCRDGRSFRIRGEGLRLSTGALIRAGSYSGHLIDGVLSDDVEGRSFKKNGHRVMA